MPRRLRVRRPFNLAGSAVALNLIVDGNECGKIDAGESMELPISEDSHKVHVRLWGEHFPDAYIPAGRGDCIATIKAPGFVQQYYFKVEVEMLPELGMRTHVDVISSLTTARMNAEVYKLLFMNGHVTGSMLRARARGQDYEVRFTYGSTSLSVSVYDRMSRRQVNTYEMKYSAVRPKDEPNSVMYYDYLSMEKEQETLAYQLGQSLYNSREFMHLKVVYSGRSVAVSLK